VFIRVLFQRRLKNTMPRRKLFILPTLL